MLLQNTDILAKYHVNDSFKVWHSYLKLAICLWHRIHPKHLIPWFYTLKNANRAFWDKSNQSVRMMLIHHKSNRIDPQKDELSFESVVREPLGRMEYRNITNRQYKFSLSPIQTIFRPIYSCYFNVNPLLKLNMTFHHIYFSTQARELCQFNRETISSCKLSANTTQILSYCGINPSSQFFSFCSDITIEIYLDAFVMHSTSMMFSVFDTDIIASSLIHHGQNELLKPSPLLVQSFHYIPHLAVIQVFSVTTAKVCQLHITILYDKYTDPAIIYDGPGPLTRSLSPNTRGEGDHVESHFLSSTFLCTIYVLEAYQSAKFHSKQHHLAQKIATNITPSGEMLFDAVTTDSCVSTKFCLVVVTTQKGYSMKVSTTNVTYQSQGNTGDCAFSGFSVYQEDEKLYHNCPKLYPIVAKTKTEMLYFYSFRDVYSHKNTVTLILYSFMQYSNFSLKSIVRTTQCKVILHNLCTDSISFLSLINMQQHTDGGAFEVKYFPYLLSNLESTAFTTKTFALNSSSTCWVLQLVKDLSGINRLVRGLLLSSEIRYECMSKVVLESTHILEHEPSISLNGFFRGMYDVVSVKLGFCLLIWFPVASCFASGQKVSSEYSMNQSNKEHSKFKVTLPKKSLHAYEAYIRVFLIMSMKPSSVIFFF